jgi:hypothetical protein
MGIVEENQSGLLGLCLGIDLIKERLQEMIKKIEDNSEDGYN